MKIFDKMEDFQIGVETWSNLARLNIAKKTNTVSNQILDIRILGKFESAKDSDSEIKWEIIMISIFVLIEWPSLECLEWHKAVICF